MTEALAHPAIEVQGLGKVYEPAPRWLRAFLRSQLSAPIRALDDVSLSIERGAVLVVAGPNGAGKSTLFRVLAGLVAPTCGRATVLGLDATRQSVEVRRALGFVAGDDRSLWLRHTAAENLLFRGRLQGYRNTELTRRVSAALERVELTFAADRVGFALSAGMRARLQLACALLHEPPVLILDEPTSAVDPVGSYRLLELVRRLAREEGVTALLSTHKVEEIEAFGDRVALLHGGRVLHFGSIDALYSHTSGTRRLQISFPTTADANCALGTLLGFEGVQLTRLTERALTVTTALPTGVLLAALNGALPRISSITEERLPLRELLTGVWDAADSRAAAVR